MTRTHRSRKGRQGLIPRPTEPAEVCNTKQRRAVTAELHRLELLHLHAGSAPAAPGPGRVRVPGHHLPDPAVHGGARPGGRAAHRGG
ncbi:hypothetical protein QJS66_23235 [Kocuria rhizophila]|nr:hypothetical protein QJS66_23235 [Kocuria rhizophila]